MQPTCMCLINISEENGLSLPRLRVAYISGSVVMIPFNPAGI